MRVSSPLTKEQVAAMLKEFVAPPGCVNRMCA
jgi:hypothetical protein